MFNFCFKTLITFVGIVQRVLIVTLKYASVWANVSYPIFTVSCAVPMDLDVNMKAVLLGGVFLIVSKSCGVDIVLKSKISEDRQE